MTIGLRNKVAEFAEVMEMKLCENDHKNHWTEVEMGYLRRRLHDELGELKRAIEREDSVENVAREAADVANFAMMIADRYAYGVLCGEYEPRPDRAKGGLKAAKAPR